MLRKSTILTSVGAIFAVAPALYSQVDTLQVVVSNANAVGGVTTPAPLGTFGYDPANDRMYIAGFSNGDQELRLISNVSGSQTVQTQIFQTAWFQFTKAGNLGNGGGSPTPSALLLNPQAIPGLGLAAYSNAWIFDIGAIVTQGSPAVPHPEWTQRIYKYNLQQDTNSNASDEFTSVMTAAQYQTAASAANTSSNMGRQFAWSGDGQSFYFADTSTNYGGIWKMDVATATPTRLMSSSADMNTEPAVLSSGGVDSIFIRGGGTTGNVGGIDKITYDGTTASARTIAVSAATMSSFFELSSGSIQIASMCSDADGNLYFNDTGSTVRPGIYRLDPQGRISKVVSRAERQATFAVGTQSVNANTLRMQSRTTTFGTGSTAFPVTQILYAESTPINLVAGAYVFKPGDFNRDNQVNQADIDLFKTKVDHTHAVPVPVSVGDLKFDMNGSGTVDWKDIKIFQQFDPALYDGDTNMDGQVDISDLAVLATNWQTGSHSWLGADFTGDDFVDISDLALLATNWQMGVPAGAPLISFADAAASLGLPAAAVPEPASLALLMLVAAGGSCRRHRH